MESMALPAGVLRFGAVQIEVDGRRLLVEGVDVPLGARAFDLLVALAERRDRVVPRSELLDLVWPGLVVEEGNLAVQVSTLRKVLGAQAIATVPGRGYRFTLAAPVAHLGVAPPVSRPPEPPRALGAPLPPMPTALLGRSAELATLGQMLTTYRLVTVVGAGGIGNTSLVLEALRHRDPLAVPAALVELAPMSDASLLPGAIAQALRIPLAPQIEPIAALVSALGAMHVLLVLDNAEHLVGPVATLVSALLRQAPGVRLLVTSQVALKVDDEHLLRLGPLAVPLPGTPVDDALAHGAVALFVAQARAADQRFTLSVDNVDTVIDLCASLDGLALAIKLAAARVSFLGLKGLHARLNERLKLLRGGAYGAPTRQQTLEAALDWSHGLLGRAEQRVFRRLAVFVGGFTLELACAVVADDSVDADGEVLNDTLVVDCLAGLVERSLVAVDAGDPPRYRLLESAREYAWLRLREAGELDTFRTRHTHALTALFERADVELWFTHDDVWLAAYTPELDNARAALDWAVQQQDTAAVGLMASLARLLFQWPLGHETRRRSEAVLPLVARIDGPSIRAARYWVRRSHGHWGVNQSHALDCARKAVELFRQVGTDDIGLHEGLFAQVTSLRMSDAEIRSALAEMRALERPAWPARVRADFKVAEMFGHYAQGLYEDMHRSAREGLAVSREAGSRLRINILQWYLCTALRCLGRLDEAFEISRAAVGESGPWRGWSLGYLMGEYIWACLKRDDLAEGRRALREFMDLSRGTGWTAFAYNSLTFAELALRQARHTDAAQLLGYADAAWRRLGTLYPDMAQERARILAALRQARLPAGRLESLMALGESLDETAVCQLVLQDAS